jgi:hypothetical protein
MPPNLPQMQPPRPTHPRHPQEAETPVPRSVGTDLEALEADCEKSVGDVVGDGECTVRLRVSI